MSLTKNSSLDAFSVSDETMLIFTWVVYCAVCQSIIIFGLVTNIINIICFVKQGFNDSVNVSLLGLSISDLGCLTTMSVTVACYTPAVRTADLSFEPIEVSHLITGIPHMFFSRVTCWITALITMERCLCITAPLKIKGIITPRRATVINVCVSITLFSSTAPVYVVNKLDLKFSSLRNKTVLGLAFSEDSEQVEMISYTVNFVLMFTAFIIIVICTITLVMKLKDATKWRMKSANQSKTDVASSRNQKVARMVVMISTLFIACFVPLSISMLAIVFEPDLTLAGKYFNIMIIIAGFDFFLEAINSSTNIFIYYNMSSKYRVNFHQIFCKLKTE